ncbi:MAG: ABC transporter permease [Bacteroidota bacterium]
MTGSSPLRIGLSWWIMGIPLLIFLAIPLVALLLQTNLDTLIQNLLQPQVYQALWLSLKTSFLSLLVTVTLGTPLAFLLAHRTFPFKRLVDTLVDLPMVLPPAVAGVALLMAFGRNGLIGQYLGVQIPFTQLAVVMAQVFVAAPLYVRAAIIGFNRMDRDLEEAAILDGAQTRDVMRYVTLPVTGPALLGGAALTWARALGEFGATIIFAGNLQGRTQTMPLAIYLGFELDTSMALTLSVLLLAGSFLVLFLLRRTLTPDAS